MTHSGKTSWLPYKIVALIVAAALAFAAQRDGWRNLFLTPEQHGRILLDRNQPAAAAEAFRDPLWRGIALFRAGDFKTAAQSFAALDTAESAYDQGNALVMLGAYEDAVKRYDRALTLRPGWPDAITNREIARIRAERKKTHGDIPDDIESKPDEIVYDKTKKGGEDTTLQEPDAAMSDEAVRAIWLKRVQTRPAEFLRVKFSYQLQSAAERGGP